MIKKLILLGFGLTLLIGLPLALFVLQNQTQPTTGAAPVTKFSFNVPTDPVQVGQNFDVPIVVDPNGQNQVSFVKFAFTYDPAKLDKAATPVTIDPKFTQLQAPAVTCTDTSCQVSATLSIGSDQTAVIKTAQTVATMHFIAKANTDPGTPTQLAFVSGQNQALSVGASDQAAENVFQTGVPASITIGSQGTGTGTTTTTPSPTTTAGTGGTGTGTGGTGATGGTGNTGALTVTCTSFTPDKTSGNPPLIVTFTTVGTSSTDSIAKLDINYGDGSVDSVASGSGMGTGNVNNQISHTYSANGTFTASAVLTTSGGATSDTTACKTTITVGNGAITGNKLPPTGPGQTILLIGGIGGVVALLGAVALFGL